MSEFVRLIGSMHRGSIAGKVVDGRTRQPIAKAVVSIQSGPPEFDQWPAKARRTTTAQDGFWGFVDLPDGDYTVTIEAPRELHYATHTTLQTAKQTEDKPIIEYAPMSPTGVEGLVHNKDTRAPLHLARVRVHGSNEIVYCDRTGRFLVTGVFPGECTLIIDAVGYRQRTFTMSMALGTIGTLGVIFLEPNGA